MPEPDTLSNDDLDNILFEVLGTVDDQLGKRRHHLHKELSRHLGSTVIAFLKMWAEQDDDPIDYDAPLPEDQPLTPEQEQEKALQEELEAKIKAVINEYLLKFENIYFIVDVLDHASQALMAAREPQPAKVVDC